MTYSVKMAGQDITSHVQVESIVAKDILGQGAGSGATRTGRAATCEFMTDLGPANSAVGAGTSITSPQLVRKGEVVITDANGINVFGGFVATLTDRTDKKSIYTYVTCIDYWQALDSIQIHETYSGVSDVFIMRDLLTKYAPWVNQSHLPTLGSYTFTVKVYKAISLQKALAQITDVTGFQVWMDGLKNIFYVLPTSSFLAPFSLSTSPNNLSSFTFGVDLQNGLVIDDTAAINRVTFWGGKNPSNDFTQDLSTQANGSNTVFVLAYYPRVASSGVFHINAQNINSGADLTYGYILGRGAQNQFISKGGLARVLLNSDARTLNFDPGLPAPTNGGAGTVTMTYRYEFPMIVQLTDQASFRFFGAYYDGVISDQTVFDQSTAVARCRTLLSEQSKGLTTLKVWCWKAGLQSGQILNIVHSARNINGSYMIQEVDTTSLGNGLFQYNITCGAWNYNVVDSILAATQAAYQAQIAPINDSTNGQDTVVLQIIQQTESVGVHDVWSLASRYWGGYYANATPQLDGTDAYAGLFTVAALNIYGSNVVDGTIVTACQMSNISGGTEVSVTTTFTGANHYSEIRPSGGSATGNNTGPSTPPTGKGWAYHVGKAGTFSAGNWSAEVNLAFVSFGANSQLTMRVFKYSAGTYTLMGSSTVNVTATAKTTYAFSGALTSTSLGSSDIVYVDLWYNDPSGINGDNPTVYVSNSASAGVNYDMLIHLPDYN